MNVLVTGGLGYVGSHLVRSLAEQGHDITVLDVEMYSRLVPFPEDAHVRVVREDARSLEGVARATYEADAVVHLAAIVGDEACNLDPERAVHVNYLATRQLASLCHSRGVPVIFASTCSVYGAKPGEIRETDDLTPLSIYGMSKLAAEEALRSTHPEGATVLRFGTLFGYSPRMRFDLVINKLIAQAIQDRKITVFGGDQWRPFLHVMDAAETLARLAVSPKAGLFNAGGRNYRIAEIAQEIAKLLQCEISTFSELKDRRTYFVNSDRIIKECGVRFTRGIGVAVEEIREAIGRMEGFDYRDPRYSNAEWLRKRSG